MLQAMKLLGGTEKRKTKNKNGEAVRHLEITEVLLSHCNIANTRYQYHSSVLSTYVPNKSFSQISTQKHFIQSFHKLKYGLLNKTPWP